MEAPREDPSPKRSNQTSKQALSYGRLKNFVQEKPQDGNISVMLPDCTPTVKTNRKQKTKAMDEEIKLFHKRYDSKP